MARVNQTNAGTGADSEETTGPLAGEYLTDGRALFRVERTMFDDPKGDLLVELEDCATLELIVCSERSLVELGMRPVKPRSLAPA